MITYDKISTVLELEASVNQYLKDHADKSFEAVLSNCKGIFESWYRRVQCFTNLDRRQLWSEFLFLVLKTLNQYEPMQTRKWNGFECYLRSSAKKLGISLNRQAKRQMAYLPDKFDMPDPKSNQDTAMIDTVDALDNCCLNRNEKAVVVLRAMGNKGREIQDKLHLTAFRYRDTVKNIRSNRKLQQLLKA